MPPLATPYDTVVIRKNFNYSNMRNARNAHPGKMMEGNTPAIKFRYYIATSINICAWEAIHALAPRSLLLLSSHATPTHMQHLQFIMMAT